MFLRLLPAHETNSRSCQHAFLQRSPAHGAHGVQQTPRPQAICRPGTCLASRSRLLVPEERQPARASKSGEMSSSYNPAHGKHHRDRRHRHGEPRAGLARNGSVFLWRLNTRKGRPKLTSNKKRKGAAIFVGDRHQSATPWQMNYIKKR